MLRRPMVVRRGPGLLGTMARTAVVAGTATAVTGGMRRRQQSKAEAQADDQAAQQAAHEAQQQAAATQAQVQQMQAAPQADLAAKLKELADLKDAGALSDEEFAAAKAKLLG